MESQSRQFKLFVGGFNCNTPPKDIFKFFQDIGELKVDLKMKRKSEVINLGYCILEMEDKEIYNMLLNTGIILFEGRRLEIKPYLKGKDLEEYYKVYNARRIQLKGLPKDATHGEIKLFFAKFGKVSNAYHITDFRTLEKEGVGFVIFEDPKVSMRLVEAGNVNFKGHLVDIQLFNTTGLEEQNQNMKPENNKNSKTKNQKKNEEKLKKNSQYKKKVAQKKNSKKMAKNSKFNSNKFFERRYIEESYKNHYPTNDFYHECSQNEDTGFFKNGPQILQEESRRIGLFDLNHRQLSPHWDTSSGDRPSIHKRYKEFDSLYQVTPLNSAYHSVGRIEDLNKNHRCANLLFRPIE